MNDTALFLIIWTGAAITWELYAVFTRRVPTISHVMMRLPKWARWIIILAWTILLLHWWI
jgi:hypothetical protein